MSVRVDEVALESPFSVLASPARMYLFAMIRRGCGDDAGLARALDEVFGEGPAALDAHLEALTAAAFVTIAGVTADGGALFRPDVHWRDRESDAFEMLEAMRECGEGRYAAQLADRMELAARWADT
ncbi:hypothetical protein ACPEEZ_03630 [Frigoribacterium sp. 2-23]|uniref:hypothetical protein n=1 Tax=Frigoribacterium sp. 2-23 TaxID=3415006 RepID=UPI003C6F0AD0